MAAETGQAQMADLLVRNKANVNCRDNVSAISIILARYMIWPLKLVMVS